MKGEWIKAGNPERPYAEVVADDSGMVYIGVQSGAVRTSDYLIVDDAERFAWAILDAAKRCRGHASDDPPTRSKAEQYDELRRMAGDGQALVWWAAEANTFAVRVLQPGERIMRELSPLVQQVISMEEGDGTCQCDECVADRNRVI